MGVTAIVGLQWGDEGKGKIVDALSEGADFVVRCQGGANAGHTVFVDGRKFVLHLVPSGILREGVTCLIGNGVVVDLDALASELRELGRAGIRTEGRLVVSRRAHVVLPYHKSADRREESSRGAGRIGTTMRGIGPCYSDKCARVGLRVGDLVNRASLDARLAALARAHPAAPGAGQAFDVEEARAYCAAHLGLAGEIAGDVDVILDRAVAAGKQVVLEGAQGFLLDVDHGTYPFVTSSNTGVHGLASGCGLRPSAVSRVVGVLKAYVTRVGEGPMPTEMEEPYQSRVREKGGEFGATTGRPRRCGWLDLVGLEYASIRNGVTSVVVTKMDTLSGLDRLQACVEYRYAGAALDSFPSEAGVLAECVPRYVGAETWDELRGATTLDDLPVGARRYLDVIREAARCRVEMISVGPGRDDVIEVED
ncbi:MAG: adenylosuccinate synthase [bacterium]